MTTPPNIRVNFQVPFPALVQGSGQLTVTKNNGIWTIALPAGVLTTNTADQIITGGANVTSLNLSTISSGTITIDCGLRPLQYLTNNGAFTLAAPATDGSMMLLITNGASAGIITFSGFNVGALTGDPLDTTSGHKFSLSIWRINSVAGYRVAAHQ